MGNCYPFIVAITFLCCLITSDAIAQQPVSVIRVQKPAPDTVVQLPTTRFRVPIMIGAGVVLPITDQTIFSTPTLTIRRKLMDVGRGSVSAGIDIERLGRNWRAPQYAVGVHLVRRIVSHAYSANMNGTSYLRAAYLQSTTTQPESVGGRLRKSSIGLGYALERRFTYALAFYGEFQLNTGSTSARSGMAVGIQLQRYIFK